MMEKCLFGKWCWKSQTTVCKLMKSENTLLTTHKINSKWLKDVKTRHKDVIRHDTTKIPEESIGKTFSDMNRINVFLGQFPKAV